MRTKQIRRSWPVGCRLELARADWRRSDWRAPLPLLGSIIHIYIYIYIYRPYIYNGLAAASGRLIELEEITPFCVYRFGLSKNEDIVLSHKASHPSVLILNIVTCDLLADGSMYWHRIRLKRLQCEYSVWIRPIIIITFLYIFILKI